MTTLALWDAQDHAHELLVAARAAEPEGPLGPCTVDLGTPTRYDHDHVWISGEVDDWTRDPDGTYHDLETYRLRLHAYVELTGDEYLPVRDRLKAILDAALTALEPQAWVGAIGCVYSVRITRGQVEETIVSEQPVARAMLATVWLEVKDMVDHAQLG